MASAKHCSFYMGHNKDYALQLAKVRLKPLAFVNRFISTGKPRQWFGIFKFMYDRLRASRPLLARSRTTVGNRVGAHICQVIRPRSLWITGQAESTGLTSGRCPSMGPHGL